MLALLLVSLLVLPSTPAQTPVEMTTYQVVLLKKGAGAPPASQDAQMKMQQAHLARLADLNRTRINLLYGPILAADSPYAGIAVLDVKSAEEAKQAFADDPFVKAGVMAAEVHAWHGPKGWFHQPPSYDTSNPANLEPLIFGLLMRGSNTSQDRTAAEQIQKGHLAYMDSLHAQGTLALAGPFADDGDMRGIVVYRVRDVEQAKALAAQDPAIKAGRLTLVAYPWMTFKGILP